MKIQTVLVSVLALLLSACVTRSRYLLLGETTAISHRELLASLVRENPIAPAENLHISLLGSSEHASVHLVQVRGAEVPHVHETHDLTVFVVSGCGELTLGYETKAVTEGDVIHIPAGVRHYFVNKATSIAVAVVVFSPPFDGKDMKPVE